MHLNSYLYLQEKMLCAAFEKIYEYPIGIESISDFDRAYSEIKYSIEWDPRVRNNNAFIRTIEGNKEYWVRTKYSLYQSSFKRFLSNHYHISLDQLSSYLHVDHLYSRKLAIKSGINYLRLALVGKTFNSYFGVRVERQMLELINSKKPMIFMDYFTLLKVLHIPFPKTKLEFQNKSNEISKIISEKTGEPINLTKQFFESQLALWDVFEKKPHKNIHFLLRN